MKQKEYDLVIITHLPAFYKTNLYNEVSKKTRLFVVFIGYSSSIREEDFTGDLYKFDYAIIHKGRFEQRSKFKSCYKVIRLLLDIKYSFLIVNGWDLPEFWLSIIISGGQKGVAMESSIYESKVYGFKRLVKRVFLSFLDFALPSGVPHAKLLNFLNFKKPLSIVGGVGLPVMTERHIINKALTVRRFLYVGRLAAEKNLRMLIDVFNGLQDYQLTIIGTGPIEAELRERANPNIKFTGHVNNVDMSEKYRQEQVLILPSLSEPWGLVIEEALQNGLPVIVSNTVGSRVDLVEKYGVGVVMTENSHDNLLNCIHKIVAPEFYNVLLDNTQKIDFENIYKNQIESYTLQWLIDYRESNTNKHNHQ